MCQILFIRTLASIYIPADGCFFVLTDAGHQRNPRVHGGAILGPAGLRGDSSVPLEWRNLASINFEALKSATAKQGIGNPHTRDIIRSFFNMVSFA